jgi:predicted RNA binding protein YcfA (HicA-like mRNA interferase family)
MADLPKLPSSGPRSKFPPDMPKLPSVSGERVVKALKRAGFVQLRQKGSHVSLERRAGDQTWKTVVPMHSEVAKGTLSDILKQSGLTLAEFLELL